MIRAPAPRTTLAKSHAHDPHVGDKLCEACGRLPKLVEPLVVLIDGSGDFGLGHRIPAHLGGLEQPLAELGLHLVDVELWSAIARSLRSVVATSMMRVISSRLSRSPSGNWETAGEPADAGAGSGCMACDVGILRLRTAGAS